MTVRDPREYPFADIPVHAGFAEVGEETKKWYERVRKEREQLSEDAREEHVACVWEWGASLRHQWVAAQRMDKDLAPSFQKTWKPPHDQRLAVDGLLEQLVTPENKEPRLGTDRSQRVRCPAPYVEKGVLSSTSCRNLRRAPES